MNLSEEELKNVEGFDAIVEFIHFNMCGKLPYAAMSNYFEGYNLDAIREDLLYAAEHKHFEKEYAELKAAGEASHQTYARNFQQLD